MTFLRNSTAPTDKKVDESQIAADSYNGPV